MIFQNCLKFRLTAREITYNNSEISLVVFMPNITTNHAIIYTNSAFIIVIKAIRSVVVYNLFCASKWTFLESLTVWKDILILRMFYQRSSKFCSLVNAFSSKIKTEKRNTHKTVIFMVRKRKAMSIQIRYFFLPSFLYFTLYKAFTQMYVSRRTKKLINNH